jgi:hypothetical protein
VKACEREDFKGFEQAYDLAIKEIQGYGVY